MRISHVVFKKDDLDKLDPTAKLALEKICEQVQKIRLDAGKDPQPRYIVINTDEPYVDKVIKILKKNGHWDGDIKDKKVRVFVLQDKNSGMYFKDPSYYSWSLVNNQQDATVFLGAAEAHRMADAINRASATTYWDYCDVPPYAVVTEAYISRSGGKCNEK